MQADMVGKQTGVDQLDSTTRDKVIPLLDKADDIPDDIINIAEGRGASLSSSARSGKPLGGDCVLGGREGGRDVWLLVPRSLLTQS